MIDKSKFNNLVALHKALLKKAQVQTINKLVHKLRRLQNTSSSKIKESEAQTEIKHKAAGKIEKWFKTLQCLKKIRYCDAIKSIFLLAKSPNSIITSNFSTPEDLALAMLAMNPITKSVLQTFIKTFNLNMSTNADNQKWKTELQTESKRQQKLKRIAQKKLQRQQRKQQREYAEKREDWLRNNLKTPNDENKAEDSNSMSMANFVQLSTNMTEEKSVELGSIDHISSKNTSVSKTNIQKVDSLEKTNAKDIMKRKKEKNFVETKLFPESGNEEILDQIEEDCEQIFVIDPFFITDAGEQYLSTAITNGTANEELANNSNLASQSNRPFSTEKVHMIRSKHRREFSDTKKSYSGQYMNGKHSKRSDVFEDREEKSRNEDENKHPSWLAKQKIKPVIKEFKGKRITFGDNEIEELNSTLSANEVQSSAQEMSTGASISTQDIHPSWRAKQKMKPTIQAFQGTRIRFDIDDMN